MLAGKLLGEARTIVTCDPEAQDAKYNDSSAALA
jgi:hypothetical protein